MIETKDGTITGTFPELFENKRTQHSKYRIQILKFNEKHLKNPEGEPKFDVIFECTTGTETGFRQKLARYEEARINKLAQIGREQNLKPATLFDSQMPHVVYVSDPKSHAAVAVQGQYAPTQVASRILAGFTHEVGDYTYQKRQKLPDAFVEAETMWREKIAA